VIWKNIVNENFKPINLTGAMSIEAFVFRYLRHHLQDSAGNIVPSAKMHREAAYALTRPEDYQKVIWVAPRGFAKSVWNMLFTTLYFAVFDWKFKEQLLVSASQSLVRGWLRKIKWELTNNELLLADFGELAATGDTGEKWSEDVITVKNGQMVTGIGVEGASRGLHPQRVAMDDLETDESSSSEIQCEKIDNWVKATIMPMLLEQRCVIHWTGTLLTPTAVLYKAFHKIGWDDSWFRLKYSALMPDGRSIWPERFSEAWLEAQRKAMGTMKFNAEYMNEPEYASNPVIRKEWLKYYRQVDLPPYMYKVMGVDPAISTKEINDYTGIAIIGADTTPERPSNRIFTIHAEQGRWDLNSQIRRIIELYRSYHPDMIVIEKVASQTMDSALLLQLKDYGLYLPIVTVMPDKDKRRRLEEVSPLVEGGHVFFGYEQDEFIAQLLKFSGLASSGHDDMVDAWIYAMRAVKNHHLQVADMLKNRYEEPSQPAIPMLGM
jgi:predicted phage terminase large subunit-like protein